MNRLTEAVPSVIRHMADMTLFYFGVHTADVNSLPGKATFKIVYSPSKSSHWEVVSYQWFEQKDGMNVLERRLLEPDEIAHFEKLLAASKRRTGTQPFTNTATA